MTCAECQTLLLSVDSDELRGERSGAFNDHLRACIECSAKALWLAGCTEMLARIPFADSVAHSPRRGTALPGRIAAWAALPIAAALFAWWFGGVKHHAPLSVEGPGTLTTATGISVKPSAGQKATVIPTSNPKVTIIWLSAGGSE